MSTSPHPCSTSRKGAGQWAGPAVAARERASESVLSFSTKKTTTFFPAHLFTKQKYIFYTNRDVIAFVFRTQPLRKAPPDPPMTSSHKRGAGKPPMPPDAGRKRSATRGGQKDRGSHDNPNQQRDDEPPDYRTTTPQEVLK